MSKLASIIAEIATSGVQIQRTLERGSSIEWHPEKFPRTIEVRRIIITDDSKSRELFKSEAMAFHREIQTAGLTVADDPQFYLVKAEGGAQYYRAVWLVHGRTDQVELVL